MIELLSPELIRFTTYLLEGDRDGAHDVIQDVWLGAWQRFARFLDAQHLRRWCFRVARCRAVTWRRKQTLRGRRVGQLSVVGESPDVALRLATPPGQADLVRERAGTFAALRLALRGLPQRYGAPVQLHYLQGYGVRETADLLGVSHSSVKMRLVRARAHLRTALSGLLDTTVRPHAPCVKEGGPDAHGPA